MPINEEILVWRKWELMAGRNPKQIKLAKHHVRALRAWLKSIGLTITYYSPKPFDHCAYIYGMKIIEV